MNVDCNTADRAARGSQLYTARAAEIIVQVEGLSAIRSLIYKAWPQTSVLTAVGCAAADSYTTATLQLDGQSPPTAVESGT